MKSLLAGAHVLTLDDEETEHADGWILVEDGAVAAVGAGEEPQIGRASCRERVL